MFINRFARKFPPIAWRDAKLRDLRAQNRRLRDVTGASGGGRRQPWYPPEDAAAAEMVRLSGLFDDEWYQSQVREPVPVGSEIEHYLQTGAQQGLSPHPAFMASWYLQRLGSLKKYSVFKRIQAAPLLHYLTAGALQHLSPHPMFDAAEYALEHPDSDSHPGGPIGHYLASASPGRTRDAEPARPPGSRQDPHEFLLAARSAAEALRDSRGYEHLERDQPDFDFSAERALKASLRGAAMPLDQDPVVSVILPTRDRAGILHIALDSVLAQTYPNWRLIIVDDGSRDETTEMLARYLTDDRVTCVRHPESRGVAAARNTGLANATGEYVAYLDSDNSWLEDYLELMVRFMRRDGHRVAYAMSALVEEGGMGRRLYRGMPFSREALKERNYIDCIVLMHERSLLDLVGTFDERLRRNVDWDLFVRMAGKCDFGYAPFIATEYDVWENRIERITSDEPMSYRFVVRQRSLVDWLALRAGQSDRRTDLLSVVIVATADAATVVTTVDRLRATARGPLEVVVVDSRLSEVASTRLHFAYHGDDAVSIHRLTQPLPLEVARNVGASLTSGARLVFMPETAWSEPDWDTPLLHALEEYAAVQPLVLTPGGAVWSAGVSFLPDGHSVLSYRSFAGDAPEIRGLRTVPAVSAMCLAVKAVDYLRAEGFDPLYMRHHTGAELSLRLTADPAARAACVGASAVALRQTPPSPTKSGNLRMARDNDRRLRSSWYHLHSDPDSTVGHDGYAVVGFQRHSNTQLDPMPLLVHARPERPLRWAIKIGAPTVERRTNWGDWHFALALRDSLERLGHEVTIDCYDEWYRPTAYLDDVVLVLRGVSIYEVNPGHTNVSWVISHPERVSAAEMLDYDAVFGASRRWCERISPKLREPAEVLLQCTDHRRFFPVAPDRRRAHAVLAVANARGAKPFVARPAVAAALEVGIVPSVYGVRWDGLLPEGAWKGEYLPNDQLPAVYAAAGVVLNDHWDDMRDEGLLSNRLFDLTACNARVISDDLPEIRNVFGDAVLTYTTPQEIPDLVTLHLEETPERRAAREQLGRHVREAHTFDARAATLSERVLQTRAVMLERAK